MHNRASGFRSERLSFFNLSTRTTRPTFLHNERTRTRCSHNRTQTPRQTSRDVDNGPGDFWCEPRSRFQRDRADVPAPGRRRLLFYPLRAPTNDYHHERAGGQSVSNQRDTLCRGARSPWREIESAYVARLDRKPPAPE